MEFKVKAVRYREHIQIKELNREPLDNEEYIIDEDRIPELVLKKNPYKKQFAKLTSVEDAKKVKDKFKTDMGIFEMLYTRNDFKIYVRGGLTWNDDYNVYAIKYKEKPIWNSKEFLTIESAEEEIQDILNGRKAFNFD